MGISKWELEFDALWNKLYPEIDLDAEVEDLIPGRRFRFDYVHLDSKVAIEVNGGIFSPRKSRHSTGTGLERDYQKNNLAIAEGYVVFQLSSRMITAYWLGMIARAIRARMG